LPSRQVPIVFTSTSGGPPAPVTIATGSLICFLLPVRFRVTAG
jgi:hypothetical protein